MEHITEPSGYSHEDAHFHRMEAEKLARLRTQQDAVRAKAATDEAKKAHWMKCPKCGFDLKEVREGEVMVDRCGGCGGVFLDAGELELLAHHQAKDHGFLRRLLGSR